MKVKIFLAYTIIGLIITGGVWARYRTTAVCEEITQCLREEITRAAKEEPGGGDKLQRAIDLWMSNETLFACLIPHEELDRVKQSLLQAQSILTLDDMAEYQLELTGAASGVEIILKYDHPDIRSIF